MNRTRALLITTALITMAMTGALCASARAQDKAAADEAAPILRVETGVHSSVITSIASDAANHFLVSASQDKTARVWDGATDTLIETLRPPIAEGREGRLFAVAITPDGTTVACAGYTGPAFDKMFCIYLFDRASGEMTRRIGGLPGEVTCLHFSPDGKLLAAGMSEKSGVRILRVNDGTMVAADDAYGAACTSLDFASTDAGLTLATASSGGYVRVYAIDPDASDATLKSSARTKIGKTDRLSSVAFSPDGSRLAVACLDRPFIEVFAPKTLKKMYAPKMPNMHGGILKTVCWSADGQLLYAGGLYVATVNSTKATMTRILTAAILFSLHLRPQDNSVVMKGFQNLYNIREWKDGGRGKVYDYAISKYGITSLQARATGGVYFGAIEPTLGFVDTRNKPQMIQPPVTLSTAADPARFRVSDDGNTVEYPVVNIDLNAVANREDSPVAPESSDEAPSEGKGERVPKDETKEKPPADEKGGTGETSSLDASSGQDTSTPDTPASDSSAASDPPAAEPAPAPDASNEEGQAPPGDEVDTTLRQDQEGKHGKKDKKNKGGAGNSDKEDEGAASIVRLKRLVSFSVSERGLRDSTPRDLKMYEPDSKVKGLKYDPKKNQWTLDKQKLPLPPEQHGVWHYAANADHSAFVMGSAVELVCFEQDGALRWRRELPCTAALLNVTHDGKTVVAVMGDGTFRWYRMRDGVEVLDLFVYADQRRWILWTPRGQYDCSPSAEALIGWQVNRGIDQAADFFPASHFRNQFYRPDVVARILTTNDPAEALRLADKEAGRDTAHDGTAAVVAAKLPPVVSIVSPDDSSAIADNTVTVRYSVRTPSGEPVTSVKALVNGQAIQTTRDLQLVSLDGSTQTLTVPVPSQDCQVSIIASNQYGASDPASVRLTWSGHAPAPEQSLAKPKLYVLAVGINAYDDESLHLNFAAKDAQDFSNAFQRQKGVFYSEVQAQVLTDKQATREGILQGLNAIEQVATTNDFTMVFLSGHGYNDENGQYYFVPCDFSRDNMPASLVSATEIQDAMNKIAGRRIFFLDSCHSGNVLSHGTQRLDITGAVNELSSPDSGVIVYTASTGSETASEDPAWGNGAFTKALTEGLLGKTQEAHQGDVTILWIGSYISDRVKSLTNDSQRPTVAIPQTVTNFPIATVTRRSAASSGDRPHEADQVVADAGG